MGTRYERDFYAWTREQARCCAPVRTAELMGGQTMLRIEVLRQDDGRWLARVPELPGVRAIGGDRGEAVNRAEVQALRALADRLERGEAVAVAAALFSVAAEPDPLAVFDRYAGRLEGRFDRAECYLER